MCPYLSKTEDECSHAMNEILNDAFERELGNYEKMKILVYVYFRMIKFSVQECVYHIFPEEHIPRSSSCK